MTQYFEDPGSTRHLRHQARNAFGHLTNDLAGVPGLTREQAIEHVNHMCVIAQEGLDLLNEIRTRLELRDWDAHQEAKAKWKAAQTETAGLEASMTATTLDQALDDVLSKLLGKPESADPA